MVGTLAGAADRTHHHRHQLAHHHGGRPGHDPTTPPTSYGPTSKPADQLWRGEGTGGELSPGITAPASWRIQWAFDCASFEKYDGGNFKITGDGVFEQVDIQDVATQGTGTRRFTRRGFGHLRVETVCDHWTVTVLAD